MPEPGFHVYKDRRGEWRWRFVSINRSDILGDSGEGYKNKQDCLYAINALKQQVPTAPTYED
ncbi:MAG: YegP family protein [Candidatus Bathyarchaeia archaeon]